MIDGGGFDTDNSKEEKETEKKNTRMRYGVYLVLSGTVLQLVSNFIPIPLLPAG